MLQFGASEIQSGVGVVIRFGSITDDNQHGYHKKGNNHNNSLD